MTEVQQTFTPVESIEETLTESFLSIDDVQSGDEVKFVKLVDRPMIWTTKKDFTKEGEKSEETTLYYSMVNFKDRVMEMRLNGPTRKVIFDKVGNKLDDLKDKVGLITLMKKGNYSYFFVSSIK